MSQSPYLPQADNMVAHILGWLIIVSISITMTS